MNVSAVGTTQAPAVPRTAESGEIQKGGRDHDGDGDDGGAKAASRPAAPTVNSIGQLVGQHINVKA